MSGQIETICVHDNSHFSYQEAAKAVSSPIYKTAIFGRIGPEQAVGQGDPL